MGIPIPALPRGCDFDNAARAVLQFLHQRLGFSLWMVTRTEGNNWIVLQAQDTRQANDYSYGIRGGAVFQWADSFCSRMVQDLGPRIAPRSASVPAYADAPIARQVKIGSYAGAPLTYHNGSVFGTLCAIDPDPQPESILNELPLIELLADLLSGLLNSELAATEANRRAERAGVEAETDALTQLANRRGWDRILSVEEARCRRYGNPACVVSVDLDGLKATNDSQGHVAGDALICRAAQSIREATLDKDVSARVGGDEFAVLGIECNSSAARQLADRIRQALDRSRVPASVGLALRVPAKGLRSAWDEADRAMYIEKSAKKSSGGLRSGGMPPERTVDSELYACRCRGR